MTAILVVEDDASDAALIERALKKSNAAQSVQVVRDGLQALEALFQPDKTTPTRPLPDLILLDLKLPKMNGFEVLQKIKSNPQTRYIPIVVLTSSRLSADVQAAYDNGANSYLVKPNQFGLFSDLMERVVQYWMMSNQPPSLAL